MLTNQVIAKRTQSHQKKAAEEKPAAKKEPEVPKAAAEKTAKKESSALTKKVVAEADKDSLNKEAAKEVGSAYDVFMNSLQATDSSSSDWRPSGKKVEKEEKNMDDLTS